MVSEFGKICDGLGMVLNFYLCKYCEIVAYDLGEFFFFFFVKWQDVGHHCRGISGVFCTADSLFMGINK